MKFIWITKRFKFKYVQLDDALKNLLGSASLTQHLFTTKQFVPSGRKDVFSFFSKAENLEVLTPTWLNFHIQKKSTPEIEKGTLIDYQLKIHGVPVKWRTEIREWNPDSSFVDFQLKGPYNKWHHLHTFEDVPGGTLICDEVTFKIPGWIFGNLLLPLIRKDVGEIFKYRQTKIKDYFYKASRPCKVTSTSHFEKGVLAAPLTTPIKCVLPLMTAKTGAPLSPAATRDVERDSI